SRKKWLTESGFERQPRCALRTCAPQLADDSERAHRQFAIKGASLKLKACLVKDDHYVGGCGALLASELIQPEGLAQGALCSNFEQQLAAINRVAEFPACGKVEAAGLRQPSPEAPGHDKSKFEPFGAFVVGKSCGQ